MAPQLFCLALLAVSAFGHDLTSRQQYVPQQDYSSQSYGLYNQQPAGSMQGQLPYMNYILQKQNYYLPYLVQKMQFIPAHAQQWIPQLRVPTGVEGQVNSPVNQLLWNREQALEVPQLNKKLVISHEVDSKKDKHSVVFIPLNQVSSEEQQEEQQQQQESILNKRQVQDNIALSQWDNQKMNLPLQQNNLPYQVRDVNQKMNILQNTVGLVRSYPEIVAICQRINMPVHEVTAVRDINQILNIDGNTEGLIRSYPEILDVCQRINMLVQGLVHQNYEVTDANQRVNLPFQGLVRPTFEASELSQRVPFGQSNIDGTLSFNNVLAPRYQSASQYQFQPMSQVYPARQNIFSLLGLRPTRPAMQVAVDPTQQIWEQNVPTYFANNDDFARNNLNVERNLLY